MTFKHTFGTPEYEREVAAYNGFPYNAELTYKHPYWWDEDYKNKWNIWLKEGQLGDEPIPPYWHTYGGMSIEEEIESKRRKN